MPFASFKAIREVSSEDSSHPARNLIKQEANKVWKTKDVGEKSAYVIFELEKPVKITGIDIGNQHSCFIEVLVSKTGCSPSDFTEILLTCSFMTPIESKNSTSVNRVRCFNCEALVTTASSEKWQFVKVLCTQPFNKHVQYGLAFIKLHISDDEAQKEKTTVKSLVPEKFLQRKISTESNDSGDSKPTVKAIGVSKFSLREESPDSESESTNALFKRWKTSRSGGTNETTTAAAIRQASAAAGKQNIFANKETKVVSRASNHSASSDKAESSSRSSLDRNREQLLFKDEDDDSEEKNEKTQRLAKQIESEREALKKRNEELKKAKESAAKGSTNKPKPDQEASEKNKVKAETSAAKKTRLLSPKPNQSLSKKPKLEIKRKYKPFNQLLSGVVIVISGIQNPDRANLRSKALEMGAKYKGDWGPGCTHLICAFKNTPKYAQVKGHGKIVTRHWIEKCYALKKYLPWRRYALDSDDSAAPESDEEILDESLRPSDETMAAGNDENENENLSEEVATVSSSDTDDEIERVRQKEIVNVTNKTTPNVTSAKKQRPSIHNEDDDVYEVSTEEEDYLHAKLSKT